MARWSPAGRVVWQRVDDGADDAVAVRFFYMWDVDGVPFHAFRGHLLEDERRFFVSVRGKRVRVRRLGVSSWPFLLRSADLEERKAAILAAEKYLCELSEAIAITPFLARKLQDALSAEVGKGRLALLWDRFRGR
jgi:hypothetical protein